MLDIITYLIAYGVSPVLMVAFGFEFKSKKKEIEAKEKEVHELREMIRQERESNGRTFEEIGVIHAQQIEELKQKIKIL